MLVLVVVVGFRLVVVDFRVVVGVRVVLVAVVESKTSEFDSSERGGSEAPNPRVFGSERWSSNGGERHSIPPQTQYRFPHTRRRQRPNTRGDRVDCSHTEDTRRLQDDDEDDEDADHDDDLPEEEDGGAAACDWDGETRPPPTSVAKVPTTREVVRDVATDGFVVLLLHRRKDSGGTRRTRSSSSCWTTTLPHCFASKPPWCHDDEHNSSVDLCPLFFFLLFYGL